MKNEIIVKMLKILMGGKNWATTLAGIIAGLLGGSVVDYLAKKVDPTQPDALDLVAIAVAVLGYVWGRVQKSANVTGVGESAMSKKEVGESGVAGGA